VRVAKAGGRRGYSLLLALTEMSSTCTSTTDKVVPYPTLGIGQLVKKSTHHT